nr:uncharacterized protein LOC109166492 [Ipomoea batatas]
MEGGSAVCEAAIFETPFAKPRDDCETAIVKRRLRSWKQGRSCPPTPFAKRRPCPPTLWIFCRPLVINKMSSNRHWMYTRMRNGVLTKEFLDGLKTFIGFATSQRTWMDGERIRCPCTQRKCQNTKFLDVPTVKYHLAKFGFVSDYYVWRFHGERILPVDVDRDVGGSSQMASEEPSNAYHTMVIDAAGVEFNVDEIEESPNLEAQNFYDMLKAADQELFPECKKHSQLSFVARLMSLKSENHISEKCFNQITELIQEVVPNNNLVPDNFYETKRLLRVPLPYSSHVPLKKIFEVPVMIGQPVRKSEQRKAPTPNGKGNTWRQGIAAGTVPVFDKTQNNEDSPPKDFLDLRNCSSSNPHCFACLVEYQSYDLPL